MSQEQRLGRLGFRDRVRGAKNQLGRASGTRHPNEDELLVKNGGRDVSLVQVAVFDSKFSPDDTTPALTFFSRRHYDPSHGRTSMLKLLSAHKKHFLHALQIRNTFKEVSRLSTCKP